jgi:hypothetical protein
MTKLTKVEMSMCSLQPQPLLEIDAGKGESNPTLGEGETGLIIRINYPGQTVLDQRSLDLGGDYR